MAPKKPKIEEYEPFVCNECQHAWDKKRNARKQCPSCGGANVEATGPLFRLEKGEKIEVKKEPAVVARPPSAQMSAALTPIGKETFVTEEEMTPLEMQFASLLQDLGVKLPNALTKMVFRVDPHSPVKVDDILRRYHIPAWKRQFVVDAWCGEMGVDPVQIQLTETEQKQGEGVDDMDGSLDRMMRKMERFAAIKMMKEMFMPTQAQPQFPGPPPQQQQQVPLFDEEGMPVMAEDGQPVTVPAWQYQMVESSRARARREDEALKQAAKPSEMEAALALAKEFIAMSGSNNDPEMMIKLQELTSRTQMQEVKGTFDVQLGHLQATIDKTSAIEEVEARYNNLLAGMQKNQEQLQRELEDQRRERIRSIEDAQVRMQSDINSTLTEAAKEGLGEFRETRRDMKEIAKEQMRSQQLAGQQGPYPPGTQPGYSPVQELTPAQLEADFAGRGLVPQEEYYYEGGLDDAITVPEDGDEDRHY